MCLNTSIFIFHLLILKYLANDFYPLDQFNSTLRVQNKGNDNGRDRYFSPLSNSRQNFSWLEWIDEEGESDEEVKSSGNKSNHTSDPRYLSDYLRMFQLSSTSPTRTVKPQYTILAPKISNEELIARRRGSKPNQRKHKHTSSISSGFSRLSKTSKKSVRFRDRVDFCKIEDETDEEWANWLWLNKYLRKSS